MTRTVGLGLLVATFLAGQAAACPPASETLLFHSCWGTARARIILLPEDSIPPPPEQGRRQLVVTGAYTATDSRAEGRPKPVGLFIHDGRTVNPNLGRMDGILTVDRDGGGLALHHRRAVEIAGRRHALATLPKRRAFAEAASAAGLDVLQSHLLVIDGHSDVSARGDAPRAVRRLLFTDRAGYGVFQTAGPATLGEAADAVRSRFSARMALNLDMGRHDYCRLATRTGTRNCGFRGTGDTAGLSNLLAFTLP
jgi:hypothetical protein